MEKTIVIIDGNSLINRAYYAMRQPMITKDGIYTQGIFGFLNMLFPSIPYVSPVFRSRHIRLTDVPVPPGYIWMSHRLSVL